MLHQQKNSEFRLIEVNFGESRGRIIETEKVKREFFAMWRFFSSNFERQQEKRIKY